jgi:hypothetical protein
MLAIALTALGFSLVALVLTLTTLRHFDRNLAAMRESLRVRDKQVKDLNDRINELRFRK